MPEETTPQAEMFDEQGNPITTPPEGEEKKTEENAESKFEARMTAMEQSNTELKGRITEQNETIQSQQEALNARPAQQQQQQQAQVGGYTDEQKEAYERQFGMPFEQIVGTQNLISNAVSGVMTKVEEREAKRELRETQRDIRSNDEHFKFVEADVNKRFNSLPSEQKNVDNYVNLVRQVKVEKMPSIIESKVTERMNTNKGIPPKGEPKIGDSGNGSNFQGGDANTVKLTPAQIRQCVKGGIDPKKAEERFNKDLREE